MRMTVWTVPVVVGLLAASGSAFADSCPSMTDCTYQLTYANDTGALGTLASYGSVELKLFSGQIQFLVNLAAGYTIFGSHDAFGFSSSLANDPATLNVSSATAGYGPNPISQGSTAMDGFGKFEYVVTGPNNPPSGVNSLSFTIGLPSGNFSDVHDLVEGTPTTGSLFAAHIFNNTGSCNTAMSSCTGYVGTAASASAVPEPVSYLWLMAAGFGLIVFVFHRRRRSAAN